MQKQNSDTYYCERCAECFNLKLLKGTPSAYGFCSRCNVHSVDMPIYERQFFFHPPAPFTAQVPRPDIYHAEQAAGEISLPKGHETDAYNYAYAGHWVNFAADELQAGIDSAKELLYKECIAKCCCGAESCGDNLHSDWCEKYEKM